MIIWQPTELSIVDANGDYIQDQGAGIAWALVVDASRYLPGSAVLPIVITSVSSTLWRRLRPTEIRNASQSRRVVVAADITGLVVGPLVEIPMPGLEAGNFYQVEIVLIASGVAWTRTREVRCPA